MCWQSLDVALDNLDAIIEQAGEKDLGVEGVMNVVCWLFQRVLENNTPPAEAVTLVDKFVKKLTANSKSNPILRLKTLSTIYNVLGGNGTARYNVFVAIVTFAAAAGKEQLALLAPQFAQLDEMLAEWGTDIAKTRDLYTIIFTAMSTFDNKCPPTPPHATAASGPSAPHAMHTVEPSSFPAVADRQARAHARSAWQAVTVEDWRGSQALAPPVVQAFPAVSSS